MKKVLVIGLDGGDFRILTSFFKADKLKAFKRIIERGCHGRLKSTIPAITIPAWPAMFSGKNPGKLGAVGFSRLERDYSLTPFNSLDWKRNMVWTLLGGKGLRVGLVNVPGTNPVYKISGFIISSDFGKFEIYPYDLGVNIKLKSPEKCISNSQMLRAAKYNFEQRAKAVISLIEGKDWDLFIWVIRITDVAMHWGNRKAIEKAYILAERYIADVLKIADRNDWNVFVTSDHGIRRVEKVFNLNTFLEKIGYLEFREREKKKGFFFEIARFLFKFHLKPFLMAGYRFLRKFTEKISQFDPEAISVDIKWDQTKAFTLTDTTSNSMGIWINSKSNFDGGTISSEEEEVIKKDLISKLVQFKDEDRPVIKEVWRKEELYPNSSRYIPDLFIETEEGYAPDFRSYDKIIAYHEKHIHDPYGIFIAYGPDVLHKTEELKGLEIVDIAPTILHIFGLPIPTDVDGRVLKEIFRPESEPARREVKYGKYSYSDGEQKEIFASPEEEKIIKERLKGLGYLG